MGLIYLAVVLVFAAILSFDQKHLIGAATMALPRPFLFAVDAFFANGFDAIVPDSLFTYLVGVVDMIAGLITLSTLTAVVFSRLSSNDTHLRFSRHLCITSLDEGHLFCRFVTSDPSQWLNVSYSLTLILDDEVEPGVWQRRTRSLALLNGGTPQLSQTATLTHPLDANSPIQQLGLDELKRRNAVLMPLVEGVDEITGAGLLQTHLYRMADVLNGRRFGNLVSEDSQGRKRVNINRLNQVVPV
jgi:inward rectifier potassium channel